MTERPPPLRDPHLAEVAAVAPDRRHPDQEEGRRRLLHRRDDRDLRLHRLRHRRGPLLQRRLLPGERPALGHAAVVRDAGHRVRGPPAGRHHRRLPRRQDRPQARPRRVPAAHGHRHRPHRPPAHVRAGRCPGAHPARRRPRRAGPGVRRRMGRRDPDVLRARPLAQEGPLHRHHPGRLPGRAAAGQPGLPGQRAAGRLVGVAGAVPAQRRPDRRRHPHPAQARGVPGVRGAQGGGRGPQEPAARGAPQRLAQRAAGVLPAHRRDRRLRRVRHLHAVLPGRPRISPTVRSP